MVFYWTGLAFWAVIACAVAFRCVVLVRDDIYAGIFIARLWRITPNEPWIAGRLLGYWFRLSVGTAPRPKYLQATETGEYAFWPGLSMDDVTYLG